MDSGNNTLQPSAWQLRRIEPGTALGTTPLSLAIAGILIDTGYGGQLLVTHEMRDRTHDFLLANLVAIRTLEIQQISHKCPSWLRARNKLGQRCHSFKYIQMRPARKPALARTARGDARQMFDHGRKGALRGQLRGIPTVIPDYQTLMMPILTIAADGGVDGVIDEDRLGLDRVYVRAKRYAPANTVQRREVQGFVGSLVGFGASKGALVTTSSFSAGAKEHAKHIPQRVVLIDDERLTELMVEHDVGVRRHQLVAIKRVDEDFFSEE